MSIFSKTRPLQKAFPLTTVGGDRATYTQHQKKSTSRPLTATLAVLRHDTWLTLAHTPWLFLILDVICVGAHVNPALFDGICESLRIILYNPGRYFNPSSLPVSFPWFDLFVLLTYCCLLSFYSSYLIRGLQAYLLLLLITHTHMERKRIKKKPST